LKTNLPARIAASLLDEINAAGLAFLPSIGEIAQRNGVSYASAQCAVRILKKDGVVRCGPGKRAIEVVAGIGGIAPRQAQPRPGACGRISEEIRRKIIQGEYSVAEYLPKVDYLCTHHHASPHTIIAALRDCERGNIVHKSGKRWIAGPAKIGTERDKPPGADSSPVLLMVVPFAFDAERLFSLPHLAPFAHALKTELIKYGISIVAAQQHTGEQSDTSIPLMPAGIEETVHYVKRLGSRYAGTLLVNGMHIDKPEFWAAELHRFRKPVLIFDAVDRLPGTMGRDLGLRRNFFRLHLDERAAVMLAVKHVLNHGHRTIGTLDTEPTVPKSWSTRRIGLIRDAVAALDAGAAVVDRMHTELFWSGQWNRSPHESTVERFQTEFSGRAAAPLKDGAVVSASRLAALLDGSPSFVSVLRRNVTAIVAVNDSAAQEYYIWLLAAGLGVPRNISLIAFDNLPSAFLYPITTIDFGFQQLGYLAAHIAIGDFAVRADAEGNLPGKVTLIDRGSVAAPPAATAAKRLGLQKDGPATARS